MMFSNLLLFNSVVYIQFVVTAFGAPRRDQALIYLTQFGYFDGEVSKEQLEDGTAFKNALLEFQNSAGLEATGTLTDETVHLMSQARCGFKDKIGTGSDYRSKRYALQGSSWRHANIKYKISKYPRRLSQKAVDQELARAFSVWSNHADITFIPSQEKSDIEITFEKYDHGDENPFDGKGGVLAHANFPINGGSVHFDASEDWAINATDAEQKELYKTAAHEIGHALGLGHSDVLLSLMAPFYNPFKTGSLTNIDDIQAIQSLYGKKPENGIKHLYKKSKDSILCQDAKIDSIYATDNGDIYLFKGDNYWTLSKNGSIYEGYPKKISTKWSGLPTPVDAAFLDAAGKTYFFIDTQLWRYSGSNLDAGYPKRISEVFPGLPSFIDTAFVWGGNGKLYIFRGSTFWKCDTLKNSCLIGSYPKPISNWMGLPNNVDGALHSKDGYTYFFKGESYYKFDDTEFKVTESDPPYPRRTTDWWFDCEPSNRKPHTNFNYNKPRDYDD